jgi:predicted dinucleotide-binding enzyme
MQCGTIGDGEDTDAKTQFHSLVDPIDFAPVDIGSLRDGGRVMRMDRVRFQHSTLSSNADR